MSGREDANLELQVLREGDGEKGKLVGSVSLMPGRSLAAERAERNHAGAGEGEEWLELGYWLDPDVGLFILPPLTLKKRRLADWRFKPQYQHQGIMRAGVNTLLEWGKREMGVRNVIVRILEENRASRGVIEGLIKEGWGFERDVDEVCRLLSFLDRLHFCGDFGGW